MHRMKEFMEKLEDAAKCEFDKGIQCVNTKEMGEVIDMIKDCAMTLYYYSVYEAMQEEEEHDRMYYNRNRYANGRFAPAGRGMRRGFDEPPYWHMIPEHEKAEMFLSDGYTDMHAPMVQPSRYGYSHDEYMREKTMHPGQDEMSKKARMEKLSEYLDDLEDMARETIAGMSQDEKQAWKVKLNKLINM